MKVIVLILLVLACIKADPFDDMKKCIEERCPDQYKKCISTSGCEEKLKKCADKCGLKMNQSCYTFCLGVTGAATNAAICAANKGCISSSMIDRVGLTLMSVISNLQSE
jgi:hypothetical protein